MPLSIGFVGLCVLAFCTLGFGQDLQRQSKGYSCRTAGARDKRALSLAVKGVQALKHLLRCAVPVKSTSQSFRKYEKPGNVKTAIQDFYSIDPQNSKRMIFGIYKKSKPGKVLTGTVGDRRVILLMEGDRWSKGRPVLEVIDTKITDGPKIDRIVYKKLDGDIFDY